MAYYKQKLKKDETVQLGTGITTKKTSTGGGTLGEGTKPTPSPAYDMLGEYEGELQRKGFLPAEIEAASARRRKLLLQTEEDIGIGKDAEDIKERLTRVPTTPEQEKAAEQVGVLTPEQEAREIKGIKGSPTGEMITTGAGAAATLTSGAIGAGIGTAILPGVGTAIGFGIGALIGTITAGYTAEGWQTKMDSNEIFGVYTAAKGNMQWVSTNIKNLNPMQAEDMWDNYVADVRAAQRAINRMNGSDLDKFLGGGAKKEAIINGFIARIDAPGGLNDQMKIAIRTKTTFDMTEIDLTGVTTA